MAEDRRRDALLQIGLTIGSAVEIDALLRLVMGHVTSLLAAERSTLYLVDRRRNEIWSKVLQGDGLREIRLPLGQGVAGDVVATGEPANIADAYQDPRFHPEFDRLSGFRTRTILCAPVWGKHSEVLGAVQVLNREDGKPFDEKLFEHQIRVKSNDRAFSVAKNPGGALGSGVWPCGARPDAFSPAWNRASETAFLSSGVARHCSSRASRK